MLLLSQSLVWNVQKRVPWNQEAFNFLKEFIYGSEFDTPIRNGLRYSQKVDDVLQHQDVSPKWKKVVSPLEANKKKDVEEEEDLSEKGLESSRMDGIKHILGFYVWPGYLFKLTQVFPEGMITSFHEGWWSLFISWHHVKTCSSSGEFGLILRMQPPGTDDKIMKMEVESKDLLKEAQKDITDKVPILISSLVCLN